jgi:electron transfer flavoprotein alpha subunit
LHAIVLGEAQPVVSELSKLDLVTVVHVPAPELSSFDPDLYCEALSVLAARMAPDVLVFPHSYQSMDLTPKLAASLGRALVTDCVGFRDESGTPLFLRQMFRNRLNAEVRIHSDRPWLVTVQAGSFAGEHPGEGNAQVMEAKPDLGLVEASRTQLEKIRGGKGTVDLSKAEYIVGVGRGMKSADTLPVIQELAELLGGEVGASRPVVDNEWLDRERQIGSSGQNVSPKLYIACGISGAIQHLVGIKGAGCTVAINTDPNAPIFNVSDYGIVGDLTEVIPALIKRIRDEKGLA